MPSLRNTEEYAVRTVSFHLFSNLHTTCTIMTLHTSMDSAWQNLIQYSKLAHLLQLTVALKETSIALKV